MKIKLKIVAVFSFSAFLLNFLWEAWHSVYLYKGHNDFTNKFYVNMVTYVSVVDVLILLAVFLIGMLIWKNYWCSTNVSIWKSLFIIIVPLLVAIFIEAWAIYFINRWEYNELMPTILGLGLSPLLQLPLTMYLSILLTRQLWRKNQLKNRKENLSNKDEIKRFSYKG